MKNTNKGSEESFINTKLAIAPISGQATQETAQFDTEN
jgi:hypothetical protein